MQIRKVSKESMIKLNTLLVIPFFGLYRLHIAEISVSPKLFS